MLHLYLHWSLRTQLLLMLFASYCSLIYAWSSPWVFEKFLSQNDTLHNTIGTRVTNDGTRRCKEQPLNSEYREFSILDARTDKDLCSFKYRRSREGYFLDDNTFLVSFVAKDENGSGYIFKSAIFTRRFPEWWWGHFYRPEVWLLPLWLGAIVWTIRKDRKGIRTIPVQS